MARGAKREGGRTETIGPSLAACNRIGISQATKDPVAGQKGVDVDFGRP